MARRYRQSPVFYDPSPARWPWALALLLLVAAVAFAVFVRPDLLPLERLNLPFSGAPA